ncbi:MAG: HAMP domain-containing histidine kinase [Thermoanaerobaculia bacterium]|nr:HAMP domain-containing histidine kinase [Thermoanaerobaculia bacterium]
MNIRAKLTLRFSVIVASILILFSVAVYWLSSIYRREEFYTRLESRAITTGRLIVKVSEVDMNLLRIIDQNSIHALFEEQVLVFDADGKLIYNGLDDYGISYTAKLINDIRERGKIEYTENDREVVGIRYTEANANLVIISSAYDRYGRSKLKNLGQVLIAGLVSGIGIILLSGRIFAQQALRPLARMNNEITKISAGSLNQRVAEGENNDEIAQLAQNFNLMLERLEAAFAIQQQFVTNASHELRNPLAAITSQLQATLSKPRSSEEYQEVLKSVFDDTRTLVELTNGLLVLAQSGIENQRNFFQPVRVDEAVFSAQTELAKNFPHYHFQIGYSELPDDDNALKIMGIEQLLKTAFLNFMDNACKFSPDHSVQIMVSFPSPHTIEICFGDRGPGIPAKARGKIFDPFFRVTDTPSSVKGHGIGLSLCHRIVQLHGGSIRLDTAPGKGTRFFVSFPTYV